MFATVASRAAELPRRAEEVQLEELHDRRVLHHDVRHHALPREPPDGEHRHAHAVGLAVDGARRRRGHVVEEPAPLVPRQQDQRVVRVRGALDEVDDLRHGGRAVRDGRPVARVLVPVLDPLHVAQGGQLPGGDVRRRAARSPSCGAGCPRTASRTRRGCRRASSRRAAWGAAPASSCSPTAATGRAPSPPSPRSPRRRPRTSCPSRAGGRRPSSSPCTSPSAWAAACTPCRWCRAAPRCR